MKDPRLASYSFVGLDPIFFFQFREEWEIFLADNGALVENVGINKITTPT